MTPAHPPQNVSITGGHVNELMRFLFYLDHFVKKYFG